jgi:triacylglycerol lipase
MCFLPVMRRTGRYSTARARSLGIEALSTLREVALSPFDIAPVLPCVKRGDDLVVLVHGFCASAGVFRPMRQQLEAQTGASVATFTHVPGAGVKRIALSLARIVDRIPQGVRIHLVGHSLGGLVARWYVQELGGHGRVTQTISLAAPFGGAPAAHAFPWLVGADLRPSSSVLERLRSGATADVPHTSIMGTEDRVVFPIDSATFQHGKRFVLHGRGHNSLLFDPEVHRIISGCIVRTGDSELDRTG